MSSRALACAFLSLGGIASGIPAARADTAAEFRACLAGTDRQVGIHAPFDGAWSSTARNVIFRCKTPTGAWGKGCWEEMKKALQPAPAEIAHAMAELNRKRSRLEGGDRIYTIRDLDGYMPLDRLKQCVQDEGNDHAGPVCADPWAFNSAWIDTLLATACNDAQRPDDCSAALLEADRVVNCANRTNMCVETVEHEQDVSQQCIGKHGKPDDAFPWSKRDGASHSQGSAASHADAAGATKAPGRSTDPQRPPSRSSSSTSSDPQPLPSQTGKVTAQPGRAERNDTAYQQGVQSFQRNMAETGHPNAAQQQATDLAMKQLADRQARADEQEQADRDEFHRQREEERIAREQAADREEQREREEARQEEQRKEAERRRFESAEADLADALASPPDSVSEAVIRRSATTPCISGWTRDTTAWLGVRADLRYQLKLESAPEGCRAVGIRFVATSTASTNRKLTFDWAAGARSKGMTGPPDVPFKATRHVECALAPNKKDALCAEAKLDPIDVTDGAPWRVAVMVHSQIVDPHQKPAAAFGCSSRLECEWACARNIRGACTDLGFELMASNAVRGEQLLTKQCELGDGSACSLLGTELKYVATTGHGLAADPSRAEVLFAKAFKLFQQACNKGRPEGCLGMATGLELGLGVAKDEGRAAALKAKYQEPAAIRCANGECAACDAEQTKKQCEDDPFEKVSRLERDKRQCDMGGVDDCLGYADDIRAQGTLAAVTQAYQVLASLAEDGSSKAVTAQAVIRRDWRWYTVDEPVLHPGQGYGRLIIGKSKPADVIRFVGAGKVVRYESRVSSIEWDSGARGDASQFEPEEAYFDEAGALSCLSFSARGVRAPGGVHVGSTKDEVAKAFGEQCKWDDLGNDIQRCITSDGLIVTLHSGYVLSLDVSRPGAAHCI